MVNEGTGNGFFSRLKNVFSSSADTATQEESAHESSTATTTLTEELVMTGDEITGVTEPVNTTAIRTESVTEKEIPLRG